MPSVPVALAVHPIEVVRRRVDHDLGAIAANLN
jgi:hypothetical protein